VGLLVDDIRGQQEIVIKSLGRTLANVEGISGSTVLGNGQVALILDIQNLVQTRLRTEVY
jgi:two-component system chemotaxis sensor kinase CheA